MAILHNDDDGQWQAAPRAALVAWLVFYGLFFVYAFANRGEFLLVDNVNLVTHEAGHFFFGWFGDTIRILGGTLGELLVPLLIGGYFFRQRHTTGVAFCAFWFFENFPYIGRYMADARTVSLPLVGSGDHDWEILFTRWDLMVQDKAIGGATTFIGWIGMLAAVAWLVWMTTLGSARAGSESRDATKRP